MTSHIYNDNDRRKTENSVFLPFSEAAMKLLDELIEESRKEIFQNKYNDIDKKP